MCIVAVQRRLQIYYWKKLSSGLCRCTPMTPPGAHFELRGSHSQSALAALQSHGMYCPGMSVCLTPNGDVVFHGAGDLIFQSLL